MRTKNNQKRKKRPAQTSANPPNSPNEPPTICPPPPKRNHPKRLGAPAPQKPTPPSPKKEPRPTPWWMFCIFFIFSLCSGRGKEESKAPGRGDRFLIENPRGGGVSARGRGRGAGRLSAANWFLFWGGGLNIFFRGRNVHRG